MKKTEKSSSKEEEGKEKETRREKFGGERQKANKTRKQSASLDPRRWEL